MQRRPARGQAHISLSAQNLSTAMASDLEKPSRMSQRSRIWVLLALLVFILTCTHFIWPTVGAASAVRNYSNADVKAKNKYGNTALHSAIEKGNEAIVRLLVDRGADVKAKDNNRETVLHWAARGGERSDSAAAGEQRSRRQGEGQR